MINRLRQHSIWDPLPKLYKTCARIVACNWFCNLYSFTNTNKVLPKNSVSSYQTGSGLVHNHHDKMRVH
jgi:hypothetical protein